MNHSNIGSVKIQNVSGEDYVVGELGNVVLHDQGVLELLAAEDPNLYGDYDAALRLVTTLTTAQLYQDIQAGKIVLLETIPPLGI